MTEKPRTWTVAEAADGYVPFEPHLKDEKECSFLNERLIPVIELEPVLDLLEGLRHKRPLSTVERDADALLRDHGRLR